MSSSTSRELSSDKAHNHADSALSKDTGELTSKMSTSIPNMYDVSSELKKKSAIDAGSLHLQPKAASVGKARKTTKASMMFGEEPGPKLDTPVSKPKHSMPPIKNTMERYLDDQYANWVGRPATTFGTTGQEMPHYKAKDVHFQTLPSDLGSVASRPAGIPSPWTRRVSVGGAHEASDSEGEETKLSPMAKIIEFTSNHGKDDGNRRSDKRRRIVEKDGDANIQYKNISKRRRRYISDLYTTLVDSSWIETLFLFATSFYLTWLAFAVAYYVICYVHGDLEENHLPKNQDNSSWKPCVWEIEDFASCFLFSLETQHTIGYGSRQTTNECVSAMIVMSLQSVLGCLIQAFMVGLVFAKLSRPKHRAKTVVFSKHAVVCEMNRKLCMIFRVGDMRHDSFIVNANLSVKIIRRRVTEEGEMLHEVIPLKITPNSCEEPCIFLIWPITVVHVIDEESPLYRTSAAAMAKEKFELHMVLEGVTESTSMTFQARSSYLPTEILWGHRFEPMMLYRRDINKHQVNFSAFHSTYEVDTPLCSSFELEQYYKAAQHRANFNGAKFQPPPPSFVGHGSIPPQQPSIHFNQNVTASSSSTESGDEQESTPFTASKIPA